MGFLFGVIFRSYVVVVQKSFYWIFPLPQPSAAPSVNGGSEVP